MGGVSSVRAFQVFSDANEVVDRWDAGCEARWCSPNGDVWDDSRRARGRARRKGRTHSIAKVYCRQDARGRP